ncbi:MAG TPA: ABC transporter ATP-binding protein [Allosphingosinicella sp.]
MSTPHPLLGFYRSLTARRRWQLAAVLAVTLLGALAELMTIGASLGFLTLIAAPDRVDFASGVIARLGGDPVVTASMLLVAAAIAAALIRLLLLWLATRFVMAVGHDMAARIFARMLRQPYAEHVRRGSSEILSGIEKVQSVVVELLQPAMQGLTAGLIAMLIIMMLFAIDAFAASLAASIVVLVYGIMSRVTRGRLRANSQTVSETGTARIKIIQESLGGIRDIILDHAQPMLEEQFRRIDYRYRRARGVTEFITAAPRFVVEAAGIVAIALTALAMSFQPHGIVAAIPILGALALGMQRLLPLLQLTYSGWTRSTGTLQLLADIVDLLNMPVVADPPRARGAAPAPLRREIRFENVSFRHGDSGFAIDNATLAIAQGSRTGISGPTGAGKSTLLDLIIGLLEPDSGTIRIDDLPLDSASRGTWMAGIAHVPQSIYLADDSLAANIALGKAAGEIDHDRLAAVIAAAQLSDFVAELPERLATRVGERGILLSGGQRQRVGIARALYKQAPVLILDEATSALDDATQAAVMDAIMKLDGERTIIIVAHRQTTLAGCDQILHVEAGKVTSRWPRKPTSRARNLT